MKRTFEIVGNNFLLEVVITPSNQNVLLKRFESFKTKHYLQNFTKIPMNQYLVHTKHCIKMYFYSFELNNIPKFIIKRLNV